MSDGVAELTESGERKMSQSKRRRGAEVARFHVSFPKTLMERLEQIQEETHATSLTEVLKDALKVYAYVLDAHSHGDEIIFRNKESGKEKTFSLFI